jgi:hypothetical protein
VAVVNGAHEVDRADHLSANAGLCRRGDYEDDSSRQHSREQHADAYQRSSPFELGFLWGARSLGH